jgi:hypothetical protein
MFKIPIILLTEYLTANFEPREREREREMISEYPKQLMKERASEFFLYRVRVCRNYQL